MNRETEQKFIDLLNDELVPAAGCTEPIAVAYAAAYARSLLGCVPSRVKVSVCGNILKNVKSVIVPNTGGLKGVSAAAAAGIIAGDCGKKLEVIALVAEGKLAEISDFLASADFEVRALDSAKQLDIVVELWGGGLSSLVRICDSHTNIVRAERGDEVVIDEQADSARAEADEERDFLSLAAIYEFVQTVSLERVSALLDRQIECNSAIADEGIKGNYGAAVGRLLLDEGGDVIHEAQAYAAAGSDARMSGCELPVVIVSGSGNQGMTASLPVIRYAAHLNAARDELRRALLLSDLVTIYQKAFIGRLSAFCGAVSAGCGAAAGIAYLYGGGLDAICETVSNTLAMAPGMICDGAKPSCAAKIALAVRAGLTGYEMYKRGRSFTPGDGVLAATADETIRNIGRVGRDGMRSTDRVIIDMMCGS